MLALEQHIHKAINGQIEDLDGDYPEVVSHLRVVEREVVGHIETLKVLWNGGSMAARGWPLS